MTPVMHSLTTDCPVCGDVACERDLLYVETAAESRRFGVDVGDVVCTECAGDDGPASEREAAMTRPAAKDL